MAIKDLIAKVENEIKAQVLERAQKITLNAHNRLTVATPVDLGQARAGWNIGYNEPDLKVPEKPKKVKGADKVKNVLQVQDSKLPQEAEKIGDAFYITNGVEHIVYLNEGVSTQAPTNFIELELVQAVKDAEKF